MQSYRIDYTDDNDKLVVKYFGYDRARAMAAARRISRKGILTYVIVSAGTCRDLYKDTGHIVFADGRIVDRDGFVEAA